MYICTWQLEGPCHMTPFIIIAKLKSHTHKHKTMHQGPKYKPTVVNIIDRSCWSCSCNVYGFVIVFICKNHQLQRQRKERNLKVDAGEVSPHPRDPCPLVQQISRSRTCQTTDGQEFDLQKQGVNWFVTPCWHRIN